MWIELKPSDYIRLIKSCQSASSYDKNPPILSDNSGLSAAFHPDFQISVNTSPVQYLHTNFSVTDWLDYLQSLGLPSNAITVEITEGLLMNTDSSITDMLLIFRDAGIQVALDDFGTGYSSLSYLKKLDIDNLKIDQIFVRNLKADSYDLALCEAITVMPHNLGLKVIAGGIETKEQSDLLTAAGCDFGQGTYFLNPCLLRSLKACLTPTNIKMINLF
jgi:EAL domain-containing protein (putative c-di-GMP-specific phosphodiesterase class I)